MIYGFMDPYRETFVRPLCFIPIGLTARPEWKWKISTLSSKHPSFSLIPIYILKQSENLKQVSNFQACVHLDLSLHISTTEPKILSPQPGMERNFGFRMPRPSKIMEQRLAQVTTMILAP